MRVLQLSRETMSVCVCVFPEAEKVKALIKALMTFPVLK